MSHCWDSHCSKLSLFPTAAALGSAAEPAGLHVHVVCVPEGAVQTVMTLLCFSVSPCAESGTINTCAFNKACLAW